MKRRVCISSDLRVHPAVSPAFLPAAKAVCTEDPRRLLVSPHETALFTSLFPLVILDLETPGVGTDQVGNVCVC